jgi:hypothetical protein
MPKPIVVIGSSNVDFIMKMDALPSRDETVTDAASAETTGGQSSTRLMATRVSPHQTRGCPVSMCSSTLQQALITPHANRFRHPSPSLSGKPEIVMS